MSATALRLLDRETVDKQKALDAALGQIERAFGKGGEAGRVRLGGFGEPKDRVVAGYLAFEAETLFYPDKRRV